MELLRRVSRKDAAHQQQQQQSSSPADADADAARGEAWVGGEDDDDLGCRHAGGHVRLRGRIRGRERARASL
jgi:hypothetical protein